ncbi:hypothetical protein V5F77_03935 [Xanthobacter sp. DSM 24535]|uniref:hypothetical protein n=1 Tax=Roseixanthobacter psychrophilus TaxID=3119917 RepID=UPI00372682C0
MAARCEGLSRPIFGMMGLVLAGMAAGCQAPGPSWGTGTVVETGPFDSVSETVVGIPAPTAAPRVFQCTGPWAPTTSEVNLIADFGAQAISRADVQEPDGSTGPGSVLLAGNSKLRLDVAWADGLGYTVPTRVAFTEESAWSVAGVRIGSSLADVERANGRAFRIQGFGGNGSGVVVDWQKGALANMPGPCRLGVQFALSAAASDAAQAKVSGPKTYLSSDPNIRALKPTVGLFWVNYRW